MVGVKEVSLVLGSSGVTKWDMNDPTTQEFVGSLSFCYFFRCFQMIPFLGQEKGDNNGTCQL